jgi:hypothetical protein
MFMKICIAAAVMLGLTVTLPIASFAAGDNDKSASSTKAAVHQKKPKKGWSDTVHENAGYPYGTAPAYASPSLEYGYAYGLDNQGNGRANCGQRFRSYDPGTGTYLGYDGARHPCP